jgi:hypothetical protein
MKVKCTRKIPNHTPPCITKGLQNWDFSLNKKQTIFREGLVFLTEFVKQHGHYVVPTHYPQNQQLAHWSKYLCRESHKLFTTGTSKVKLENAMELAELGFYKKKNVSII